MCWSMKLPVWACSGLSNDNHYFVKTESVNVTTRISRIWAFRFQNAMFSAQACLLRQFGKCLNPFKSYDWMVVCNIYPWLVMSSEEGTSSHFRAVSAFQMVGCNPSRFLWELWASALNEKCLFLESYKCLRNNLHPIHYGAVHSPRENRKEEQAKNLWY